MCMREGKKRLESFKNNNKKKSIHATYSKMMRIGLMYAKEMSICESNLTVLIQCSKGKISAGMIAKGIEWGEGKSVCNKFDLLILGLVSTCYHCGLWVVIEKLVKNNLYLDDFLSIQCSISFSIDILSLILMYSEHFMDFFHYLCSIIDNLLPIMFFLHLILMLCQLHCKPQFSVSFLYL